MTESKPQILIAERHDLRIVYDDPEQLAAALLNHLAGGIAATRGWRIAKLSASGADDLCRIARKIANAFFEEHDPMTLKKPVLDGEDIARLPPTVRFTRRAQKLGIGAEMIGQLIFHVQNSPTYAADIEAGLREALRLLEDDCAAHPENHGRAHAERALHLLQIASPPEAAEPSMGFPVETIPDPSEPATDLRRDYE